MNIRHPEAFQNLEETSMTSRIEGVATIKVNTDKHS